jgi:hypothetical protein
VSFSNENDTPAFAEASALDEARKGLSACVVPRMRNTADPRLDPIFDDFDIYPYFEVAYKERP